MTSYSDVMNFLNYVDANINGDKYPIKGGGKSTEPYDTYESMMNNIFSYTRFIFGNNEKNKKDLVISINELDKCRKHKEEICNDSSSEYSDENDSMKNNPMETDSNIEENTIYDGALLRKGKELE